MKSWSVCLRCATAYPQSAGTCPRHDVDLQLYGGPFGAQRWVPQNLGDIGERSIVVRIPPSPQRRTRPGTSRTRR